MDPPYRADYVEAAANEELAATCDWCGAEIRFLRCEDSVHCQGCGARTSTKALVTHVPTVPRRVLPMVTPSAPAGGPQARTPARFQQRVTLAIVVFLIWAAGAAIAFFPLQAALGLDLGLVAAALTGGTVPLLTLRRRPSPKQLASPDAD